MSSSFGSVGLIVICRMTKWQNVARWKKCNQIETNSLKLHAQSITLKSLRALNLQWNENCILLRSIKLINWLAKSEEETINCGWENATSAALLMTMTMSKTNYLIQMNSMVETILIHSKLIPHSSLVCLFMTRKTIYSSPSNLISVSIHFDRFLSSVDLTKDEIRLVVLITEWKHTNFNVQFNRLVSSSLSSIFAESCLLNFARSFDSVEKRVQKIACINKRSVRKLIWINYSNHV